MLNHTNQQENIYTNSTSILLHEDVPSITIQSEPNIAVNFLKNIEENQKEDIVKSNLTNSSLNNENNSLENILPQKVEQISEIKDEENLKHLNLKIEEAEQRLEELKKEKQEKEKKNHKVIESKIETNLEKRQWKAEYEAVVGLKHRKPLPPNPCQDSAFALASEQFSVVISADGAGSSIVSDIGAQRVVTGIYRLIHTIYNSQFSALDKEEVLNENEVNRWALILTKHAMGILDDLSKEYRRESNDFRCTLLVGLVGKYHTFWFKVGDGAIVKEIVERNSDNKDIYSLSTLGETGKEEYANETTFISQKLQIDKVSSGSFSSRNLSGLFVMSDGSAIRFTSTDGKRVATALSGFAQNLREGKLYRINLTKYLYSEAFQLNHDGDDCSIALIAR